MNSKRLIQVSKYLSKHLRHTPEALGLTLAPGGWVAVNELLAAAAQHGFPISPAELQQVVAENDKQRFAFDETGEQIRANQGHSTEVDLQLEPQEPPTVLYHGTARPNADTIQQEGLRRMARQHVHLSVDTATASKVGSRHGAPVIFTVDAAGMQRAGMLFYCSANGVWLTAEVPPEYLRLLDDA